jgi:hypothetical protein
LFTTTNPFGCFNRIGKIGAKKFGTPPQELPYGRQRYSSRGPNKQCVSYHAFHLLDLATEVWLGNCRVELWYKSNSPLLLCHLYELC